ncbi:MAG: BamA/TamA family outer membrane protein [Bacteroidia bacterium]|jgi:hypothetical protein
MGGALSNSLQAQEQKSWFIRTMDWSYRIIQGDSAKPYKKYIFAVPIIAYKPETKWILGVSIAHIFRTHYNNAGTRPSTLRLNISYSQMKQFAIRPTIEYFSSDNALNIRAQYQYTDFAEYYWGIGPNTGAEQKELYHFKAQRAYAKIAHTFIGKWYAGLSYAYERMYQIAAEQGGLLKTSGVTGANGYTASGLGFTVYHDNRDNIYYPLKGDFIEFNALHNNKGFGSSTHFNSFLLDARKFISFGKQQVLALQLFMNTNTTQAPFRQMATLGSDVFMRGYYTGRFRDLNAVAIQAEWRQFIWGPFGYVVFAGTGTVNREVSGLANGLKPNIGIGLRVKAIPRERVNVRLDFGFGNNGIKAMYLTLHEAF